MKRWTALDDALLRERYVTHGAVACATSLGRTWVAVTRRARRLSLARVRRWSHRDDARLTVAWGVHPIPKIARSLGRTEAAIYWRAQRLALGLGCPQGHIYLSRAAERAGYATSTLRMILSWAGVRVGRATTRPGAERRGTAKGRLTFVVEPADVDDAVARWCGTETLERAAESRGVGSSVLARLLGDAAAAGDERVPAKPRVARKHWRVPSVLVDELVGAYVRRESLAAAALRRGLDPRTLHGWLAHRGISVSKAKKIDPDDVDRVVTERLADPRCRSPRRAA